MNRVQYLVNIFVGLMIIVGSGLAFICIGWGISAVLEWLCANLL